MEGRTELVSLLETTLGAAALALGQEAGAGAAVEMGGGEVEMGGELERLQASIAAAESALTGVRPSSPPTPVQLARAAAMIARKAAEARAAEARAAEARAVAEAAAANAALAVAELRAAQVLGSPRSCTPDSLPESPPPSPPPPPAAWARDEAGAASVLPPPASFVDRASPPPEVLPPPAAFSPDPRGTPPPAFFGPLPPPHITQEPDSSWELERIVKQIEQQEAIELARLAAQRRPARQGSVSEPWAPPPPLPASPTRQRASAAMVAEGKPERWKHTPRRPRRPEEAPPADDGPPPPRRTAPPAVQWAPQVRSPQRVKGGARPKGSTAASHSKPSAAARTSPPRRPHPFLDKPTPKGGRGRQAPRTGRAVPTQQTELLGACGRARVLPNGKLLLQIETPGAESCPKTRRPPAV